MGDLVYLTAQEKYAAIVQDIRECVKRSQPVLVGTVPSRTPSCFPHPDQGKSRTRC